MINNGIINMSLLKKNIYQEDESFLNVEFVLELKIQKDNSSKIKTENNKNIIDSLMYGIESIYCNQEGVDIDSKIHLIKNKKRTINIHIGELSFKAQVKDVFKVANHDKIYPKSIVLDIEAKIAKDNLNRLECFNRKSIKSINILNIDSVLETLKEDIKNEEKVEIEIKAVEPKEKKEEVKKITGKEKEKKREREMKMIKIYLFFNCLFLAGVIVFLNLMMKK